MRARMLLAGLVVAASVAPLSFSPAFAEPGDGDSGIQAEATSTVSASNGQGTAIHCTVSLVGPERGEGPSVVASVHASCTGGTASVRAKIQILRIQDSGNQWVGTSQDTANVFDGPTLVNEMRSHHCDEGAYAAHAEGVVRFPEGYSPSSSPFALTSDLNDVACG